MWCVQTRVNDRACSDTKEVGTQISRTCAPFLTHVCPLQAQDHAELAEFAEAERSVIEVSRPQKSGSMTSAFRRA